MSKCTGVAAWGEEEATPRQGKGESLGEEESIPRQGEGEGGAPD